MKKYLLLIPVFLLLLTGCGSSGKKTVCTLTRDVDGVKISVEYTLNHDDKYISNVVFDETYEASDKDTADYYENYVKELYEGAKEKYGGYEVDVQRDNLTVKALVKINYEKVDMTKLLADTPELSSFVEENKMLYDKMTSYYNLAGLSCK